MTTVSQKETLEIIRSKIFDADALRKNLALWKFQQKKIVFTNGCFDILHYGHIQYLCKAKDLGNVLIIGLNSDASYKLMKKSPNRPIQDEQSRAVILASLHFVNGVVLFDEETPQKLIESVMPDVLVKGADYKDVTKIAGHDVVVKNGGTVTTIEFAEGYSTTAIENKIKGS